MDQKKYKAFFICRVCDVRIPIDDENIELWVRWEKPLDTIVDILAHAQHLSNCKIEAKFGLALVGEKTARVEELSFPKLYYMPPSDECFMELKAQLKMNT